MNAVQTDDKLLKILRKGPILERQSAPVRHQAQTSQLMLAAQQALMTSSHTPLRGLHCQMHDGTVVIRGVVPSFHLKQLAQEIVRDLDGAGRIINMVRVNS